MIKPYKQINGLIEVPIYFADDGLLFMKDENEDDLPNFEKKLESNGTGLRSFNFHPIHIALNAKSLKDYNATRDCHRHWEKLQEVKNTTWGIDDLLRALIQEQSFCTELGKSKFAYQS